MEIRNNSIKIYEMKFMFYEMIWLQKLSMIFWGIFFLAIILVFLSNTSVIYIFVFTITHEVVQAKPRNFLRNSRAILQVQSALFAKESCH